VRSSAENQIENSIPQEISEENMKLFTPHQIGRLRLKNRIAMAPMAIGGLVEPDGRMTQQAIDYYRERAKGGTGLIITSLTTVDNRVSPFVVDGYAVFPRLDSGIHLPRLSKLADAVHDYGGKIAVQLTAGFGRVAAHFLLRETPPAAPSAVPCFWDARINTRELSIEEIEKLVNSFKVAGRMAKVAGMDAIELHGHEGYLLDQFKTELWNKRKDKYGGDLTGRLRFPSEVIQAVKRGAGKDFPVIYRFGLTHYLEGGRKIEEGLEIARRLESFGADALHVDAGCYDTWYWAHPPIYLEDGCMVDMAAAVKKVVDIPVIAVGKLGKPELAERVLKENKADFVAMGRPLLADPHWPNKVRAKKLEDIKPCIGDHDGCLGRAFKGKPLSCSVNPTVGLEAELTVAPAPERRSVLVIGGGPAGMEASRVAAIRGHTVTLWEREDRLGGNLIPASKPEFKKDIRELIQYYSVQLPKVGVDVRLNKEADPDLVEKFSPDAVIVATGAKSIIPDIPGVGQENVITAIDALSGNYRMNDRRHVVVIGGGYIGCDTAAYLAEKGMKITVVELLPKILGDMFLANKQYLLGMLKKLEVNVLTEKRLAKIDGNELILSDNGDKTEKLKADCIVLAVGLESRSGLRVALEDRVGSGYAIGDCVDPRSVFDAVKEGFRLSRLI
jgi:2-enoate reductase